MNNLNIQFLEEEYDEDEDGNENCRLLESRFLNSHAQFYAFIRQNVSEIIVKYDLSLRGEIKCIFGSLDGDPTGSSIHNGYHICSIPIYDPCHNYMMVWFHPDYFNYDTKQWVDDQPSMPFFYKANKSDDDTGFGRDKYWLYPTEPKRQRLPSY